MPAAKSKKELLTVTLDDFAKLEAVLQTLDETVVLHKDEEETSIKDVIGHRAHWIELYLGWYRDGQAGEEVFFPAKGYKWNELKRYNSELRKKQSVWGWGDATRHLKKSHRKLLRFLEAHSNAELYSGPMKGANNQWTAGRWAEAAGPSHYRSALKYVRETIRSLKS